jgi:hypothetical protein
MELTNQTHRYITQFNRYHLKLIQIFTEIRKVTPRTQHRADRVVLYNISW